MYVMLQIAKAVRFVTCLPHLIAIEKHLEEQHLFGIRRRVLLPDLNDLSCQSSTDDP